MAPMKKPRLVIPPAQKIKKKSRSESMHGGNAKGPSAGQNTTQRISGDNHMREKGVPPILKIKEESRSEAPHDDNAEGSSAGQNTNQRISGDNHMRAKGVPLTETIKKKSRSEAPYGGNAKGSSDVEKNQTLLRKVKGEEESTDIDESQEHEEEEAEEDLAIVKVKKFEGSYMLANVDRTNDHGVASRTRQRRAHRRNNSQFNSNNGSKGTFTEPIDV